MRAIDEDNVLTSLAQCWLLLHQTNISAQSCDSLISSLNEMGEKYGYSPKTYNLLALSLMLKNDHARALKIFESAVAELRLDTAEGEAKHLYPGNQDLAALITNYVKCNSIVKGGCGLGIDFFKQDQTAT